MVTDIRDIDIRAITTGIWETVLGVTAEEVADVAATGMLVTGCVHVSGDWEGSVTVECSEALARTATALMFAMDEGEVTDDDMRDVVGELANMTGGNVKSALGGTCALSLPSVTAGMNARISVPGTEVVERVGYRCAGERLVVTVLGKPVAATSPTGQVAARAADR